MPNHSATDPEPLSFAAIQKFRTELRSVPKNGYRGFFLKLSRLVAETFSAEMVSIWDNNIVTGHLVLQATYPPGASSYRSDVIPRAEILTSEAAEWRRITVHKAPVLPGKPEEMKWESTLPCETTTMVSIPVLSAGNDRSVLFVINLYFCSESYSRFSFESELLNWITDELCYSLDHILYQVDESIRSEVNKVTQEVSGIVKIFENTKGSVEEISACQRIRLFLRHDSTNSFREERIFPPEDGEEKENYYPKTLQINSSEPGLFERIGGLSNAIVIKDSYRGSDHAVSTGETIDSDESEFEDVEPWRTVLAPILSSSNEIMAILQGDRVKDLEKTNPFSSMDLRAIDTFARCLQSPMERFFRLRRDSTLLHTIKQVSYAVAQAHKLDELLQIAIDSATKSMNATLGSIYLVDDDSGLLVMRAGTGTSRELVGRASYSLGEGLTGYIGETGKVLTFKSWDEMKDHPKWKGKFESDCWGETRGPGTFLGVPIQLKKKVIGVWKVMDLQPTTNHPDESFTEEDIQTALVLSTFLAYAIENRRQQGMAFRQFKLLAQSSVAIEEARSEEEAITSVMLALEDYGLGNAMLSLYDDKTGYIKGYIASGVEWQKIVEMTKREINGEHILACVLRENRSEFIANSAQDSRCDPRAVAIARVTAQFVLPLRLDDEMIGTLQVDMGTKTFIAPDEELILKAFGAHLTVAISRIRNLHKSLELTSQVMSSSRFIVAETLSTMAVHSLHHRLEDILSGLKRDLEKQEVSGNSFLHKTLTGWNTKLLAAKGDLDSSLAIVKGQSENSIERTCFVHDAIQPAIDMWIGYIKMNDCTISKKLNAKFSTCRVSAHVVREILSVFLVNSIQAHAKKIEISTFNLDEIDLSPKVDVMNAFCLQIRDDGKGLPAVDEEKLFEPTFTTKSEKFGTGLGLYIARQLAREGGGDILIIPPEKSKGAVFRLVLPYL